MRRIALGILGTLALVATLALAGDIHTDGQFVSTEKASAPLAVESTAVVTNLNADQLDGKEASEFATQTQVNSVFHEATFPMCQYTMRHLPIRN